MIFRAFLLALVALTLGVPGGCAHAADAPQLKSVQVSPSGGVLLARFGANVASVKAGATLAINGGAPVVLSDPVWDASSNSDWTWWPLGPRRIDVALDDDDAVTAGTWGVRDGSNTAFEPGYYQFANSRFRQSADPAATATYTHAMPSTGRYRVSAGIVWLYGPDRTTQQVYTVSDGRGVVGTFTVDLTKPPSWDRVDNLVRLHDLGHVTLRDTTLTVKVSNGATAGILVTDALYLELDLPPPVAPGDTVTFSAPAGTVTTTAGTVGAIASAPVAHTTDADWFPYDATRKPTMQVGYNKTFDKYDFGSRIYANRWPATAGWHPAFGTIRTDAAGNLTAVSGTAAVVLWSAIGAGDDFGNWPNAPPSGTAVFRFRNPGGAADPGCTLGNSQGPGYTFGPRAWSGVPDADGKYTLRIPFARPDFVPLGQATVPYPVPYTFEVSFNTSKVITDLEVSIEGETPADRSLMTHPAAIERFKGRGFGALRFLDAMAGNSPNTVEYSDWTPPSVPGLWWWNEAEVAGGHAPAVDVGLASIAPVDADDMARWCRKANGVGWVKATTAAPHGLVTGQRPVCRGAKWPDTSDLAFDGNIPDGSKVYLGHLQCVVTGPTTLLIQVSCPTGDQSRIAGTATLGAPHALTGYRLRMAHDPVVAYADLMTFARECGVGPWVIVPHLMSDAGIAAMADATIAGTPPGTRVRVEYSNEPWNIAASFLQQGYFDAHQHHLAYLASAGTPAPEPSDPTGATRAVPRDWMECYCHLAANAHRIFKAKFDAAGRSADLVRVMGSQASWPGFPTQSIANYAFEHHIAFDELAIDTYSGSAPAQTGSYATDATAAYDRLGVDGLIDVLGITELISGRDRKCRAHRKVLDGSDSVVGTPFAGYFAGVKLVSYEGGLTEATGATSEGGRRLLQLAHRAYRSPRIHAYELARNQNLEVNAGLTLAMRYNADNSSSVGGIVLWCDFPLYNGPVGTGAPGENANPWDALAHKAQTAGAMRTWAAATGTQPTPMPNPPTPTPAPTPVPGDTIGDTIGDRIAEVEAAAADLAKAQAAADAAWAPVGAKLGAAKARMAKANAGFVDALAKVKAGAAYRRDAKGDGVTIYLPDGRVIRPAPTATPVPAGR